MKTYLLDILNKYNRFSESLDVKTILCNKSWLAFNDTGDKELYIFQENGSLIVSINGKVTNGTWQYISTNKSIILSFKGQAYMLHPSFFEGGNLAASKIRNLECPNYEICLIDYGCGKFNRKIHIMEQYP